MEYHVPSVELAAKSLKLLSRFKYKSCSLKEISEHLKANKTTCLRVLRTLEQQDFVKYDPETKKYSLGPYLIPLGNRALELNDRISIARRELKAVSAQTGLTTVLVQRLQDNRLIFIASAEPSVQEVRIAVSVGQQFPIVPGSFGRCFLAYDPQDVWIPLFRKWMVQQSDIQTEQQAQQMLESYASSLSDVRMNGYSISHGELTPGFTAVASPIVSEEQQVLLVMACIAITGLFDEAMQKQAIRHVCDAARRVSKWL